MDDMDGLDLLGADEEVGLDFSTLLPMASGLATGVASQVADSQAKNKISADEQNKLNAVLSADIAAAAAIAQADTTAPKVGRATSPTADADAAAAKLATAAEDKAAAALTQPASIQKRADAANKALSDAVGRQQKDPKNDHLAALVRAWTTISNKAQSGAISSGGGGDEKGHHKEEGGSFLTRPVLGPIPGWGVLAGGAGILGGLGVVVKKFFFKSAA